MKIDAEMVGLYQGFWGYEDYDFAFITRTETRETLDGTREESETKFVVNYRLCPGGNWLGREFETEDERLKFIEQGEIQLREVPHNNRSIQKLGLDVYWDNCRPLIGLTVCAVSFGRTPVTIEFDEGGLHLDYWPEIVSPGKTWKLGDEGFRDALCDLIDGSTVDADEYVDAGLVVRFDNEFELHIDLSPPDCDSPEVAVLGLQDDDMWIWQAK